jgi:hypothetical protein
MEKKRADNISIVMTGIGIILILLPAFEVMPDQQDGLLFSGLLCIMGAVFIKMLAE